MSSSAQRAERGVSCRLGHGLRLYSVGEYGEAMLKKGTPENVDNWPVGTGPYALQQYKVDSQIRYIANPTTGKARYRPSMIFSITPNVETPSGETADQRVPDYSRAVAGTVPGD